MPSTTYVDFRPPAVNAEWLNEVNDYVFDGSGVGTTPSGGKKDAMNVLIQSMGYTAFVDYAAGLAMGNTTQTVLYQGVVYTPKLADLPFTTSGAFEAAKFEEVALDKPLAGAHLGLDDDASGTNYTTVQGFRNFLRSSDGARELGATDGKSGSLWTTVQGALDYVRRNLYGVVNVMQYMTDAQINSVETRTLVDCTLAINLALTEADSKHALIYFPTGWYLTDGGHVFGNCRGIIGDDFDSSIIWVKTGIAGTVDIFTQTPTAVTPDEGLLFDEFSILPQSGKPARNGIKLTPGAAPGVHRSLVNRVRVQGLGSYGLVNAAADSSTVQLCVLHGLSYNRGTDTQNVLCNTLVSIHPLPALYVDCVAGSNTFNVRGNVLAVGSAGIYILNAGTLSIDDNQFEAQDLAGTIPGTNAMIDIVGSEHIITAPQIRGNRMGATAVLGTSVNIRLDNVVNARISPNLYELSNEAPTVFAITTTERTFGTSIDDGLFSTTVVNGEGETEYRSSSLHMRQYDTVVNTAGQILDRGVGTKGVWKLMTPYQPPETCTITVAAPGVVSVGTNAFANGDKVAFISSGTLPAPLRAGTTYYAKNVVGTSPYTFELAYYQGGPSIQTTTTGSGTIQCWTPRPGTASATVQNPNGPPIAVRVDPGSKTVRLRGSVKVLNIVSNMVVGVVPYGYLPAYQYQVVTVGLRDTVSGLYYIALIQIDQIGIMYLRGLPVGPGSTAVEVFFDNISYDGAY